MDDATFRAKREQWTRERFAICDAKAVAYTRGSDDRHANFKREGELFGVKPEIVLGIYMHKHLDAIFYYIKTGKEGPEGVAQNIADAGNYLDLLLGLAEESEGARGELPGGAQEESAHGE